MEDKITLSPEALEDLIARATERAVIEVLSNLVLNSAPQHLQPEKVHKQEPEPKLEPKQGKKRGPKKVGAGFDPKAYYKEYHKKRKAREGEASGEIGEGAGGSEGGSEIGRLDTPGSGLTRSQEYHKSYYRRKKLEKVLIANGEAPLIDPTKTEQKLIQAKKDDEEALKKDAALLDSLGIDWRKK